MKHECSYQRFLRVFHCCHAEAHVFCAQAAMHSATVLALLANAEVLRFA